MNGNEAPTWRLLEICLNTVIIINSCHISSCLEAWLIVMQQQHDEILFHALLASYWGPFLLCSCILPPQNTWCPSLHVKNSSSRAWPTVPSILWWSVHINWSLLQLSSLHSWCPVVCLCYNCWHIIMCEGKYPPHITSCEPRRGPCSPPSNVSNLHVESQWNERTESGILWVAHMSPVLQFCEPTWVLICSDSCSHLFHWLMSDSGCLY